MRNALFALLLFSALVYATFSCCSTSASVRPVEPAPASVSSPINVAPVPELSSDYAVSMRQVAEQAPPLEEQNASGTHAADPFAELFRAGPHSLYDRDKLNSIWLPTRKAFAKSLPAAVAQLGVTPVTDFLRDRAHDDPAALVLYAHLDAEGIRLTDLTADTTINEVFHTPAATTETFGRAWDIDPQIPDLVRRSRQIGLLNFRIYADGRSSTRVDDIKQTVAQLASDWISPDIDLASVLGSLDQPDGYDVAVATIRQAHRRLLRQIYDRVDQATGTRYRLLFDLQSATER